MNKLTESQHDYLVVLRKQGKSIPEISRATGIAKTTILRHVTGVQIPPKFHRILREKQGGAKERAKALRLNSLQKAYKLLGTISKRDYLFLLLGLYWGEGAKADFSIINSDPLLIGTFIRCLDMLEIERERLSVSIRVYDDVSIPQAKTFWAQITKMSRRKITQIERIHGKKNGKLLHGMCRVRVKAGIRDRLLIQSAISLIVFSST